MRYVVLRIYDIVSNAEIANHNHKSGIANQFFIENVKVLSVHTNRF